MHVRSSKLSPHPLSGCPVSIGSLESIDRPAVGDPHPVGRIGRGLRHSLLAAALLAATTWTPAASAALFGDDEARRAILDVRARVAEQQTQIDAISRKLDELSARAEPAVRAQLDAQNQLETLRQEVARLRGQLEVQGNDLANAQRRERDLYGDLDVRLKKFEPQAMQVDGQTVSVDPAERKAYDAALAQFRGGDFKAAQGSFQAFLREHPDSPFAANSMFWLGSAQFALKDYRGAINTHQSLLNKYPDNPRAADATLNLAYAQIESGDRKTARRTLDSVISRYPDTPAAQAAKDRVASLKGG